MFPLHWRAMATLWAPLAWTALSACAQAAGEDNGNEADEVSYEVDPYLVFRPEFARSLPVQILLTGIVLTLVSVLFIHLLFTAQYHWPLAQVNYVLQLSGVATLLVSLIASLHVVFQAAIQASKIWPYMFDYVAVQVPPTGSGEDEGWSTIEKMMWFVMQASTSALVQITHIHFLTLLYPSRLEGRLIFSTLGPLAVVSAIMQLLVINSNKQVNYYASALRNVCNATLSLLFTASLFVWGLLVNRRQAWRTDGGTAAFGAAALVLAVISTGLNFLYIPREEEYVWLPGLMWAVTLWQSFLGWWWWVGSGSGEDGGEFTRREEKRERHKQERGLRRQATRERVKGVWMDVSKALSPHSRQTTKSSGAETTLHDGPSSPRSNSPTTVLSAPSAPARLPRRLGPRSETVTSGYQASSASTYTLPGWVPLSIHRWYAAVRYAHREAARVQTVERVEQIRDSRVQPPSGNGWGLGSFGWRMRATSHDSGTTRIRRTRSTSRSGDWIVEDDVSRGEGHELEARSPDIMEEARSSDSDAERTRYPPTTTIPSSATAGTAITTTANDRSFWWWGPVRKWRLQDSTVY